MRIGARLQTAIELLEAVESEPGKPADSVLADGYRSRRYAGSKDRAGIAEIVYGVLRRRAELDWYLEDAELTVSARSRAYAWLALSGPQTIEQITALSDDGDYAPPPLNNKEKAVVGRLIERRDAKGDASHLPEEAAANLPVWAIEGLKTRFGDDWHQIAHALAGEAPVDVRTNALKALRSDARLALEEEGIFAVESGFSPLGLRLKKRRPLTGTRAYREGMIEIQDEGSQIASLLVDAKPGHKVVDFCAGAGGKTLAIAGAMGNTGRIIACDTSERRLARAGDRLKRAGSFIVERRVLSSARDKWVKRRAGRFDGGFDRVLIDVPCTGSGTWRRNPDQKWKMDEAALKELMALQGEIMDSASRLVSPGGRLIYITCSLMPSENEDQVHAFLSRRDDFFLHPIGDVWRDVLQTDPPVEGDMLSLNPRDHGTDGFFVAVLGRKL